QRGKGFEQVDRGVVVLHAPAVARAVRPVLVAGPGAVALAPVDVAAMLHSPSMRVEPAQRLLRQLQRLGVSGHLVVAREPVDRERDAVGLLAAVRAKRLALAGRERVEAAERAVAHLVAKKSIPALRERAVLFPAEL